jgi:phosphoadenosine phosphosulfate reductase
MKSDKTNNEVSFNPCPEGKSMIHLIFKNRHLGALVASSLLDLGIEIHNEGRVVCVPDSIPKTDIVSIVKESKAIYKKIMELNSRMFKKYKVRQAHDILKKANKVFVKKLAVAFSGGKDSLVALHLALKVNPEVLVIYNHTTVEFPETVQYVKRLAKELGFNLILATPESNFFEEVKQRGWATHENRWCCIPFKEAPAQKIISKMGIKAEITGTTRTESIYRRSLSPFRLPTKYPFIVRVNPIYDWSEWDVWSYIIEEKLPYNPLYDMGYRRIGCWCCPLNGPSHYRRLKRTHPKLFEFLENFSPKHPAFLK